MVKIEPPDYFEEIKAEAAQLWDCESRKGERNLAKMMLQQIDKVRYVISELLQNADDAGATFAQVRIDGGDFIFEHNGHDFSKEEFGAICNFAVSNKRTCQTIGFRGIGFKSTFSVGDKVYLHTPLLSVYFSKKRFTEPVWVDGDEHPHARKIDELTRISVPIKNELVENELLESFNEWKLSNYSLLFFKNLKEIKIERYSFKVIDTHSGPISNSMYISMESATGSKNIDVLKISSKPLPPPPEAIEEIRDIRNMDDTDEDVPPFVIDIILGIPTKQYLYVVLPTLTQTNLSISINASFVLTPDRTMTKEPSQSPTNRWILEEVGNLIVSSLREWLENSSLSIEERVDAYKLLQPTNATEWGDKFVNKAILTYLSKTSVVLDCNGRFQKKCLSIPKELYSIWDRETLLRFYKDSELPIIEKTAIKHIKLLNDWDLAEKEDPAKFLDALLKPAQIPCPSTTKQLFQLWGCVYTEHNAARNQVLGKGRRNPKYDFKDENISEYQIFPVLNKPYLYSSEDTIRNCEEFNESAPLKYRNLVDSVITFIDPTVDEEIGNNCDSLSEKVTHLLEDTGKKDNPKIKDLLDELSLYELDDNNLITLAHMYMYWDEEVPEETFEYLSSSGSHICLDSETAYYDKHNVLSKILPKKDSESKIVSPLYEKYLNSDDEKEKWKTWALSKKSHIKQPLTLIEEDGDYSLQADFLQSLDKYYKSNSNGKEIWADCLSLIIETDENYHQKIYTKSGVAQWVDDFRDKPCIRGDDGNIYLPEEVYWKNEVTELLEGEIFINAEYLGVSQHLLAELGVRFIPGYPEALIKKLKGLSVKKSTDLNTILSVYNKLNAVVAKVYPDVISKIRNDFKENKLAYTENETWESSSKVYRTEAGLPHTYCLHPDVVSLTLWGKLQFSVKPSLDDSLAYLNSLRKNRVPPSEELGFIKKFLSTNIDVVLQRVGCWLSIDNHWKSVDDFEYYILDKKGIPGLYSEIKSKIPQLSLIQKDQRSYFCPQYFPSAINIVDEIVWCVDDVVEDTQKPSTLDWMVAIGKFLVDNVPKDDVDYLALKKLGTQFINTKLQRVKSFYEAPYYKNKRIGKGKEGRIRWENNTIYYAPSIHYDEIGIEFGDLLDQNPIVNEVSNEKVVKALNYVIDRDARIINISLNRLFNGGAEAEEETQGVFADRNSYEDEHSDECIEDKTAKENSFRYPADFHKKIDESPREAIQWKQTDSLNYSNEGVLQRKGRDNSSADDENTPQFSTPKESDNDIIDIMAGAESINDSYFTLQPNKKTKELKIQTKRKVIEDIVHRTKTEPSKNGPAINELDESADYEDFTPNKTIDFSKIIESEKDKSAAKIEEIAHLEELQSKTKEFSKYSYGWFMSLLEMERINSEKEYANSNEITINFGKIVRETGTKRTLILQYPDRYIPQFMEDIADIPLILHIGDKTKKVTIEVANIKSYTLRVKLKNPADIDNIDLESVSQATINARSPLFLIDALIDKFSELNYQDGFDMQKALCKNIEFVFGPPGTGKTTYLARDVLIPLMRENSDCKVLVLTPTNKSADVLVRRLMGILREDSSYNEWLLRFGTTFDEDIEDKQIFKDRTFDISAVSRNVTVTTIARFPYDYFIVDDKRMYLSGINWDYIVIDEASMIPLANIILPLYMKTPQKFIIAGDPFQIQPITSVDLWKNENIYTLVKLDSFENPKTVPHNYNVKLLTTQYRSIPSIGSIFSDFTYGGILNHARNEESQRKLHINSGFEVKPLNLIKFPVSKYESIYKCKRLKQSSSYQIYSSLFTYEYVCHLSRELAVANPDERFKVGVIAPYRAQADLISKLVAAEILPETIDVNVGTIHGFQGDECDIIFAVFNTPPSISSSNEMFLNNRNIINVAVSRARDYLFIVMPDDNTENISKLVKIKKIEQLIKRTDSWIEVYSPDIEKQIFGDAQYLENNVFSTSHQSVNVYGLPEKSYEVRTENDAVDVQVHKTRNSDNTNAERMTDAVLKHTIKTSSISSRRVTLFRKFF